MIEELNFILESNRIEGVYTLDPYAQAIIAWDFLKRQNKLTIPVILDTHRLLTQNLLTRDVSGNFRQCEVTIGGRLGAKWAIVPQLMDNWLFKYVKAKTKEQIKESHIEFEKIHPFIDGNGRIGRLIMMWQWVKHNIPVEVIYEVNKQSYYDWFKNE